MGDTLVYGNSLGHQVLAEREEFRVDLQATKTTIAELKTEIATLKGKVGILKSQNKELVLACDSYMLILSESSISQVKYHEEVHNRSYYLKPS